MKNAFYNWLIQYLLSHTTFTISTLLEMRDKVEDPQLQQVYEVYKSVKDFDEEKGGE